MSHLRIGGDAGPFSCFLLFRIRRIPNRASPGEAVRCEFLTFLKNDPGRFSAGASLSETCGIGGQIRRKGGMVVSYPYPRKENRKQGRKSRPNGLTRRILRAVHFPESAAEDSTPGHRPRDGWYRAGFRCVWFHLLR